MGVVAGVVGVATLIHTVITHHSDQSQQREIEEKRRHLEEKGMANARASARAYLTVRSAGKLQREPWAQVGELALKNVGATAAVNINARAGITCLPRAQKITEIILAHELETLQSSPTISVLGAGESTKMVFRMDTFDEAECTFDDNGKLKLYAFGTVTYSDVARLVEHKLQWCVYYSASDKGFYSCDVGNKTD